MVTNLRRSVPIVCGPADPTPSDAGMQGYRAKCAGTLSPDHRSSDRHLGSGLRLDALLHDGATPASCVDFARSLVRRAGARLRDDGRLMLAHQRARYLNCSRWTKLLTISSAVK